MQRRFRPLVPLPFCHLALARSSRSSSPTRDSIPQSEGKSGPPTAGHSANYHAEHPLAGDENAEPERQREGKQGEIGYQADQIVEPAAVGATFDHTVIGPWHDQQSNDNNQQTKRHRK